MTPQIKELKDKRKKNCKFSDTLFLKWNGDGALPAEPFLLDLFHLRDGAKTEAGRGITSTLDWWLPQCTKEESL